MQIKAQELAIGYDHPLVENLNFELRSGSITGLVGANGTGKTTLLRAILGLSPVLTGTIQWNPGLHELQRKSEIGVVWQDAGLPFSVSPFRWINQLALLHAAPINQELLTKLEVPQNHRPIRNLSGGEKQRLAIYSAMFHQPKVLVLDEPTVGLDESSRNHFYNLMQDFRERGGLAILTSHYALDISAIADEVTSLSQTENNGYGFFSCIPNLSSEKIAEYELTPISNGYQINRPEPWQQLMEIQQDTRVQVQNFQVMKNA